MKYQWIDRGQKFISMGSLISSRGTWQRTRVGVRTRKEIDRRFAQDFTLNVTSFDGANGSDRLKYSGENVTRTDVCTYIYIYMRMDKGREDSENICLIIT